jgi:predicted lipoprotein with Yx(FWY)xxD motif
MLGIEIARRRPLCRLGIYSVVSSILVLITSAVQADSVTTPEGVTLVEVVRELPISQPEILWVRPGDSDGRTLFYKLDDEPGKSSCVGSCAVEFNPLLAPLNAQPVTDWTLIQRDGGEWQWAYNGRAVYTWTQETLPGEVATNVGLTETADSIFAETPIEAGDLLPPDGWEVARFVPGDGDRLARPYGVDLRLNGVVQGVVFSTREGLTLYTFDGDANKDEEGCVNTACLNRWLPLAAPAVAGAVGEFSVVTRSNGYKQWAYKGQPLYTFSDDKLPGDAHGRELKNGWNVAIHAKNFRPEGVDVAFLNGYGAALTLDGMTLYGGYPFQKRWGGRNLRDTFIYAYYQGKLLGGEACVDTRCLQTWRPFLAPTDAQPQGFWEPIARDDGRKQWAYKGFALYTYAGDQQPGDQHGQATYDFALTDSEDLDYKRILKLQGITRTSGGAGVYWNIAKP